MQKNAWAGLAPLAAALGVMCNGILMKYIFPAIVLAALSGYAGFYFGERQGVEGMYIQYVKDQAHSSVLSTQVLYASKSTSPQDLGPWLEDAICQNLLFVGGALKEYPQLNSDAQIKESLSLASQYSRDYATKFCITPSDSPESEFEEIMIKAYLLSMSALDLANTSTSHTDFLSKYHPK